MEESKNLKRIKYVNMLSATLTIFLTSLVILLNIPFLRQIFGFFFLTVFPGLLILRILKLDEIDLLEKFILCWGISVSFTIFSGLLVNYLLLSFGYEKPLATFPLLLAFDGILIMLSIVGSILNKNLTFPLPNLNTSSLEITYLVVPFLFPIISILGEYILNTTNSNIVLILFLILISMYVAFICFIAEKFPKRLYPAVIFLISISLLLLEPLRSNHIIGSDTHLEYYFFRTTLSNLYYGAQDNVYDSCLSITLLPTIYQSLLGGEPEFLFKLLHSLIYSVSPLIIYILSRKYVGELHGFLASCFFMFQENFLYTASNARSNIAILFFAYALMVFFNNNVSPAKSRFLFILFLASVVISHYSTAYVSFFIMFTTFVLTKIVPKKFTEKKDRRNINLTIILLFFALIFLWFSQVTEAPFNLSINFIESVFINLHKLFLKEVRSTGTRAFLGESLAQRSPPALMEFVFTWLSVLFIAIGLVTSIRRYTITNSRAEKGNIDTEFLILSLVCAGLLVIVVVTPYLTIGYSLQRTYTLAITVLSTFFVIGGITLSKYIKNFLLKNFTKIRACLIILIVLIPYLLCTTGAMYSILGIPKRIILNSEGWEYDYGYVHDQEVYCVRWLKDNFPMNGRIYADYAGAERLISSGHILSPNYIWTLEKGDKRISEEYIYLTYFNVVKDKIIVYRVGYGCIAYNITEYSEIFKWRNKIYDSGGSAIWK